MAGYDVQRLLAALHREREAQAQSIPAHETYFAGMASPYQLPEVSTGGNISNVAGGSAGSVLRLPAGFTGVQSGLVLAQQQQREAILEHARQQLSLSFGAPLSVAQQQQHLAILSKQQKQREIPALQAQRHLMQEVIAQQTLQIPMALSAGSARDALLVAQKRQRENDEVFEGEEPKANKRAPHMVDKLVPETELYMRLLQVEERLDQECSKQAWQIEDALRDCPSLLRTLRISVCNTHKNQPAMCLSAAAEEAALTDGSQQGAHSNADRREEIVNGPPEWTLHIFGEALGVEKNSQKLSDFLDKIEVTFPEDSMQKDRKFVWTRDAETTESFDLRRSGLDCDKEFEVDIFFSCRRSPERFMARDAVFGEALGLTVASTKDEFIHAFWAYIKGRKLHDPQDITSIKLDDTLKNVLRIDTFKVHDFPQVLDSMLQVAPGTKLHMKHRLHLMSAELKPTVAHVTISIASERVLQIYDFSENHSKVDSKLQEMMQQIATKKKRRDFLQACAESPVDFLNQMLNSINTSVQELKCGDLMKLPIAKPLCVGLGCKGGMQQQLIKEERFSAFWSLPGLEKTLKEILEDEGGERHEQPSLATVTSFRLSHNHEARQMAQERAGNVEQDVVPQPRHKKSKRTGGELPGLDPSQALQNLMMRGAGRGAQGKSPKLDSAPSQETPSEAGQSQTVNGTGGTPGNFPSLSHAAFTYHPPLQFQGSETSSPMSSHQQNHDATAAAVAQLQDQIRNKEYHLRQSLREAEFSKAREEISQNPELMAQLSCNPNFLQQVLQIVDKRVNSQIEQMNAALQQPRQHLSNGAGAESNASWAGGFRS